MCYGTRTGDRLEVGRYLERSRCPSAEEVVIELPTRRLETDLVGLCHQIHHVPQTYSLDGVLFLLSTRYLQGSKDGPQQPLNVQI